MSGSDAPKMRGLLKKGWRLTVDTGSKSVENHSFKAIYTRKGITISDYGTFPSEAIQKAGKKVLEYMESLDDAVASSMNIEHYITEDSGSKELDHALVMEGTPHALRQLGNLLLDIAAREPEEKPAGKRFYSYDRESEKWIKYGIFIKKIGG